MKEFSLLEARSLVSHFFRGNICVHSFTVFSRKRFIITNKDIYVFCSTFDMLFLIYMSLLKIMHHSRLTSVFESQGKSLHNMGVLPFMHPERDYLRINLYIITMFTGLLDISVFFFIS